MVMIIENRDRKMNIGRQSRVLDYRMEP